MHRQLLIPMNCSMSCTVCHCLNACFTSDDQTFQSIQGQTWHGCIDHGVVVVPSCLRGYITTGVQFVVSLVTTVTQTAAFS